MENNDTNTDYHKFVGVGDQKWEIAEIAIEIIFVCLRFVLTIFYIGSFQFPPENHPHLKCQFPPKISILPKSLLYKRSKKWLTPIHQPGGGVNYAVCQKRFYCFLRNFVGYYPITCNIRKMFDWFFPNRDTLVSLLLVVFSVNFVIVF